MPYLGVLVGYCVQACVSLVRGCCAPQAASGHCPPHFSEASKSPSLNVAEDALQVKAKQEKNTKKIQSRGKQGREAPFVDKICFVRLMKQRSSELAGVYTYVSMSAWSWKMLYGVAQLWHALRRCTASRVGTSGMLRNRTSEMVKEQLARKIDA